MIDGDSQDGDSDEEDDDGDDIDGFPNNHDYHDDGDDDPDDNASSWSPANLVDHLIAVAHILAPLEVHLPVIELRLHLCTANLIGMFEKLIISFIRSYRTPNNTL